MGLSPIARGLSPSVQGMAAGYPDRYGEMSAGERGGMLETGWVGLAARHGGDPFPRHPAAGKGLIAGAGRGVIAPDTTPKQPHAAAYQLAFFTPGSSPL